MSMSSLLQAMRRTPMATSLKMRCACRRGYATSNPSSSTSSAPASSSSPSTAAVADAAAESVSRSSWVSYLKGQQPVISLADDSYPEWLWTILKPKVYEDDGPGGKKERVERRKANRQAIKDRNFMQTQ
ncbi:hypothetical protein CPB84DRAFT_1761781 [Gymnopilus junonius]|uniref:Mitochondrial ribosomal protein L54 n=1 Tax=Gymnopilus junonius TaxID=109634 RepID=A0A9P5TU21_GYMJU|nr:hypothetical protein CPB84DRAFT_1796001 [Gymnopilus junonius]KAF8912251.1 hypothetical protein CPB84DRAFT_1761781 [Gymnopilus junonius]